MAPYHQVEIIRKDPLRAIKMADEDFKLDEAKRAKDQHERQQHIEKLQTMNSTRRQWDGSLNLDLRVRYLHLSGNQQTSSHNLAVRGIY